MLSVFSLPLASFVGLWDRRRGRGFRGGSELACCARRAAPLARREGPQARAREKGGGRARTRLHQDRHGLAGVRGSRVAGVRARAPLADHGAAPAAHAAGEGSARNPALLAGPEVESNSESDRIGLYRTFDIEIWFRQSRERIR